MKLSTLTALALLATLALALALTLAPTLAMAQVSVSEGWVRLPPTGAPTAAAYLTLSNTGTKPDRLLGGSTPAARSLGVHSMSMAGGVMRMRQLDGLALPVGGRVVLQPGGSHLMLTGLARPLKAGERVAVTLRFERAPAATVLLPVRAAAAPS